VDFPEAGLTTGTAGTLKATVLVTVLLCNDISMPEFKHIQDEVTVAEPDAGNRGGFFRGGFWVAQRGP